MNYIGVTESEISYNPFAYCENNPINYSDPTGNFVIYYDNLSKTQRAYEHYDIIFDAETKGGLWLDGLFGTFPNYIGTYLKQLGIKTKKYYMAKTIDKDKKKGDIFIVVYNHTVAMLHAVMVEVISKKEILVYNDYNTATKAIKYKSFLDMISQRGNYIVVAYKVG